jgi:hypothetical protein
MNEFILETFSDICQKYDIKVRLKTKRTFQLIALEDIPLSEKEVIREKVELIANKMGRKSYVIDNPVILSSIVDNPLISKTDPKITAGIWDIRIY